MTQRRNRRAGVEDRWTDRDGQPTKVNGVGKRWRARFVDDHGREHAKAFTRKVDAQRWLDDQTAGLVTGQFVDPQRGRLTFSEWFSIWSQRQVWADGTLTSAKQAADSVTFSTVALRDIRRSHVEQWVKSLSQAAEHRSQGLAPTTIKTRFNYVHMAFRAAVRDRILGLDPSDGVTTPRVRKPEAAMTIPTPEQVRCALTAAPAWFRPFIAMCAFAGLRLGEAAGLQAGDVDFLGRRIQIARQVQGENRATAKVVLPKFGSERTVHVPEALTVMLARHIEQVGTRGSEQFLFFDGGALLNRNSAGGYWRRTREVVGLNGFTLHDLRHFFASGLIAGGCDVVTVQQALGHSSASITLNVYSHLWPDAEDRARAAATATMDAVTDSAADALRTETS